MIKVLNFGEIEDDCEVVVIEHPLPGQNPGLANAPTHVHHDREVVCKQDINELTLGPIKAGGIGADQTCKYKRSDRKNYMGRAIFVEAK